MGLADDASDDDVRTALASAGVITPPGQEDTADGNRAVAAEQPGTSAPDGPQQPDVTSPSGPTSPAEAQPTRQPAETAPEAGAVEPVLASDGTVRMDRETYLSLVAGAQRGHQARTVQETEERDRVITAAIGDGKVPPSRREHWVRAWKGDPDGTKHTLTASVDKGGLAPGLLPVQETGQQQALGGHHHRSLPGRVAAGESERGGE